MAKKKCPKCEKEHGPRKKVCECGHHFTNARHPLYPEPGAGILDTPKGMPILSLPDPLPRGRTLTNDEVVDYISYEGLGYSIYGYINPPMIEDKTLARLWTEARRAMQKIVEHLE